MHFDDVLEQIGVGIFQKFAIFVCGLAALAEAIAATSVPFAMILASCDLKFTIDYILALNAIFTLGMAISGYWLGGISDISGRKYILSTTSIVTFVACFVASFSQCVIMLFTSLFMLGLGLGGNHSATRVFIIEITPKSCRGSRFVLLEAFSAVGYASAIGLSRLLVPPLASNLLGNYVRLNSWRVLFGLSGSLSIFSACLMSVFSASPRWLLGKKQEDNAIDVLRKIYAINNVKHEESFPQIRLDPITYVNTKPDTHIYQCNNPMARSIRSIRIYTKYLFKRGVVKKTLACVAISAFLFDGLVMLNIWLGLAVFSANSKNCTVVGAYPVSKGPYNDICNSVELGNLFKVNAYFSLCSFIVFPLIFFVDRIPRKIILMVCSIASGFAATAFAFVQVDVFRTILAYLLLSFIYMAEIAFRIIAFESYPTVLRSTAYGFIKIFPKVVLMAFILFLKVNCIWAFTGFGCLFVCTCTYDMNVRLAKLVQLLDCWPICFLTPICAPWKTDTLVFKRRQH